MIRPRRNRVQKSNFVRKKHRIRLYRTKKKNSSHLLLQLSTLTLSCGLCLEISPPLRKGEIEGSAMLVKGKRKTMIPGESMEASLMDSLNFFYDSHGSSPRRRD